MLAHRRWDSLDRSNRDWLRSRFHFSVDPTGHPDHQALGSLIVWNDDEISVGGGFPLHGHRDVEIVTYVRQGVLGHRDTLGSEGTMRAGTKVRKPLDFLPHAYLVVASGRIEIDGEPMGPLDGVAISKTTAIDISASQDSDLVLVEAG
jgi:redox-sensitive bicupin YhaK (pirin superfamily)